MFLSEANVLHYLVDRQFADLDTAVNGAFTVRSLTRRNRNFHVTCGDREYLVKQVKKWGFEARSSLEREAAFYRHLKADPRLALLAPQCYAYDPANSILILEFLSGHIELYDAPDRFSPEMARLCGEAMGTLHRTMEADTALNAFDGSIPWYLSLHNETDEDLAESSLGQRELARVVKKYGGFERALDGLRAEWREDTVIHGDWKLDNCLVSSSRDRLRVVDWEFTSCGDSAWDVGSHLQSYWNFWVRWPSQYPIEAIRPGLHAFLAAYAQARGCDPEQLGARAVRYAGARMLQTALETLEKFERMTAASVRLIQGSLNVLTRPEWAAEQLLGMQAKCMTN